MSPITIASLVVLGQHCHKLRKLQLDGCRGVNGKVFAALAACPLEELVLIDCFLHVSKADNAQLILDLLRFQGLTRLWIHTDTFDFSSCFDPLHHHSGTAVAWPHLTQFYTDTCYNMNDTRAARLIKTHPQLKVLYFYSRFITDITLEEIATWLPRILVLGITGNRRMAPHILRRLIQRCGSLKILYLSDCGILAEDFPEAGPRCIEKYRETQAPTLAYLDQQALNRIRRDHALGKQQQQRQHQ